MVHIFFIVLGYFFTLTGLIYTISYMNMLQIGYSNIEYINFIVRRWECLVLILGIIILVVTILYTKGDA